MPTHHLDSMDLTMTAHDTGDETKEAMQLASRTSNVHHHSINETKLKSSVSVESTTSSSSSSASVTTKPVGINTSTALLLLSNLLHLHLPHLHPVILPHHQPITSLTAVQRTTLLNAIRKIHPNRLNNATSTATTSATSKDATKSTSKVTKRLERPASSKLATTTATTSTNRDNSLRSPTPSSNSSSSSSSTSHTRSVSSPMLPSPNRLVAIAPRPYMNIPSSEQSSVAAVHPTTPANNTHHMINHHHYQHLPRQSLYYSICYYSVNPLRRRPDAEEVARQRRVKRAFARTLLADHKLCIPVSPPTATATAATSSPAATETTEDADASTTTTTSAHAEVPPIDLAESDEALHWRRPFTDWNDAVDRLLPWHVFQYVNEDMVESLPTIDTKLDVNDGVQLHQQFKQLHDRFNGYFTTQRRENDRKVTYEMLAERLVIEEEKRIITELQSTGKHKMSTNATSTLVDHLDNDTDITLKKRRVEQKTTSDDHDSNHELDKYDVKHEENSSNRIDVDVVDTLDQSIKDTTMDKAVTSDMETVATSMLALTPP
ncbi:hypothetical protein BDF22DRAFT_745804 [Syncephalis plumigaleata]|nr:hypothetical protein BDF22DRAFT_745804 [Syncephalis plumigaleata]